MSARENAQRAIERLQRQARPAKPEPKFRRKRVRRAIVCEVCGEPTIARGRAPRGMEAPVACPGKHAAIARRRRENRAHSERINAQNRESYAKHQASRQARKRVAGRAPCPSCGLKLAFAANGRLVRHTLGLRSVAKDRSGSICEGSGLRVAEPVRIEKKEREPRATDPHYTRLALI